jgi:hypothetical protein
MSIVQTLAGAIASSGGYTPPPPPLYTLTPATTSTNEGSAITFNVTGTNIVNGTYYWTIETNTGDFGTTFGSFSITSNSGSFSVTPTADTTTEGSETFTVALRSVSTSGTILSTSTSVTINDTSLSLVAPFSLDFPAGNPYLLVSNTQADWNLGTTYTIEFWSKQTNASTSNIRTVMSQGPDAGKIDLGFMYGSTLFRNVQQSGIPEPTPGIWNHVAYVANGGGDTKVYYNGVHQGTIVSPGALSDGSSDVNIGRRLGVNGQGFLGKLAMIRVSNTATYLANFSPSLSYGAGADTRLMLGSDGPLTDLSNYELNEVSIFTNNLDTMYFSKSTYPNLNNQIKAGDIVSSLNTSTTATVTGAVVSADPDNWGVPVTNVPIPGPYNFSGARHSITNNGAVISNDFPSYQSLQFVNSENDYLSVAQPSYTALGTATNHAWSGTISGGDILKGSYPEPQVGWILVGQQGTGVPYQVTLTGVSDGGTTWDLTWAPKLADNLYMDENYSLYNPANAPFNLGTTWTIEFWLKANAPSVTAGGGIWGLLNQVGWSTTNAVVVALSDNKLVFLSGSGANQDVRYDEPPVGGVPFGDVTKITDNQGWGNDQVGNNLATTGGTGSGLTVDVNDGGSGYSNIAINTPGSGYTNGDVITVTSGDSSISETFTITASARGVWTHVAIVNNASTQTVWYNGIEQTKVSGTFGAASYTNSVDPLRIGRLGPANGGTLNGKMALVRISNTAKYLAPFIPTTTYTVDANTRLFLGSVAPTVDATARVTTNNGVTTSVDVPVIVPATMTITNVSVGFESRAATVDFASTVSTSTTGTIFFEWFGGGEFSGPHTLTVNPGANTYTSPDLGLYGSGSDLTTQITIDSGLNGCTSNIYTGAWSVVCLVEGTMVTMADGSYKAIEDVRYNDLLRVWNFDLGEFSEALPVFVKQEETHDKHYRFTFSDGTVLCTVGHHVFNKQAGAFTMLVRDTTPVGTITFNEQGEEVTLISKETIEEPVKFYNVWTQYHLNLFAQGILTSNRFNNIYPIRDMKFVKDNRALRSLEEFANIDPKYISGLRLQEQPAQYTAEYISDYVHNKLERLDIANLAILTP